MRMFFTILFLLLVLIPNALLAAWQGDIVLKLDTNALVIHMPDCAIVKVCSGTLQCENKDGTGEISSDLYVIATRDTDSPVIEDHFPAFKASFVLADMDADKRSELLVYYDTGANQYGVRLYRISSDRLIPFSDQPLSSNMRSVTVEGNTILVENQKLVSSGARKFCTTKYKVTKVGLIVVSEDTELVTDAPTAP